MRSHRVIRRALLAALLGITAAISSSRSEIWGIDPSFAPAIETEGGSIYTLLSLANGKLLVGGAFARINGVRIRNLARLNADGTVDTSFDPGLGPSDTVRTLSRLPDDSVLVTGDFRSFDGEPRGRIARIRRDGSLDRNYATKAGANEEVLAVALLNDGTALIGGKFTTVDGVNRRRIARLASDGSLDLSFDPGSGASGLVETSSGMGNTVLAVAVQPSGDILVGGDFRKFNGTDVNGLVRLKPSGPLDPTFAPPFTTSNTISALAVLADGKILVGGSNYLNSSPNFRRLNSDGSLDTTFAMGTGANGYVTTIAIQPDGMIVLGGQFNAYNDTPRLRLARIYADGRLDSTFAPPAVIGNNLSSICLDRGGRVLAAGQPFRIGNDLVSALRFEGHGSWDPSYSLKLRSQGSVSRIVAHPHGHLLFIGDFDYLNDRRCQVGRISPTGSIGSFTVQLERIDGLGYTPGVAEALAIDFQGRVLIGGRFDRINTEARHNLARVDEYGRVDATFDAGSGPDYGISAFVLQPDGRILVAGDFKNFQGKPRGGLVRLNDDGREDPNFVTGKGVTGGAGYISSIFLQPDGRIVIGGWFTAFDGVARSAVARVMNNGHLDTSFVPGIDFGQLVYSVSPAPAGKVYVNAWLYRGRSHLSFIRLNSDGTEDTSYQLFDAPNTNAKGLFPQADGQVLTSLQHSGISSDENYAELVRYTSQPALDQDFGVAGMTVGQPLVQDVLWRNGDSLLVAGGPFTDGRTERAGLALLSPAHPPQFSGSATAKFSLEKAGTFQVNATSVPAARFGIVGDGFPSWASLNPTSGVISGTPPADSAMTYMFTVEANNGAGGVKSQTVTMNVALPPRISQQPQASIGEANRAVTLSVTVQGSDPVSYQWYHNGSAVAGATTDTLQLERVQAAESGIYSVVLTNNIGSTISELAFIGVLSSQKVDGSAREVGTDIVYPSGNVYDQVLMSGPAATITADSGQITRTSFIDIDDDIVQVELSGPGSLTILLADASGPAAPTKYTQDVLYMKGHASLFVSGATEKTNLSVFTVGRITALNPSLFRNVEYDGIADIARIVIASANGKFGGLRASNVSVFDHHGATGVFAPSVEFVGPLYLGLIEAFDEADPVLLLGGTADARITGGNLEQPNGRAVQVSGISRLNFTAGATSHGVGLPAQRNRAQLKENGRDVTAEIVADPSL